VLISVLAVLTNVKYDLRRTDDGPTCRSSTPTAIPPTST
jgi:hypothetical protein